MRSAHGSGKWVVGKWRSVKGEIATCHNGFHASKQPLDALSYIAGEVLAVVEGKGDKEVKSDKVAFREMRILEAYRWTKKDSVALGIFCAELCIKEFEKEFPDDKRPRDAIKAAKAWLKNPSKENTRAAYSAANSAASATYSAVSATYNVANSAASAASAIYSATYSATACANSAVDSANSAADSVSDSAAAYNAVIKKINTWIKRRIKKLEPITEELEKR